MGVQESRVLWLGPETKALGLKNALPLDRAGHRTGVRDKLSVLVGSCGKIDITKFPLLTVSKHTTQWH